MTVMLKTRTGVCVCVCLCVCVCTSVSVYLRLCFLRVYARHAVPLTVPHVCLCVCPESLSTELRILSSLRRFHPCVHTQAHQTPVLLADAAPRLHNYIVLSCFAAKGPRGCSAAQEAPLAAPLAVSYASHRLSLRVLP